MLLPLYVDYPYTRRPYATIGLIVANVLAFGAMHVMPDEVLLALLCWPDSFAPWQWMTAVFLHADLFHLGGNMLFLFVYGRYVEERLGPARFMALYAALGVAASWAYIAANFGDDTPALGASGAISGLMGVALVAAHSTKVRSVFLWGWYARYIELPTLVIMGVWLLEQFGLALLGSHGIAVSAHLGGFAAGALAAWLLSRDTLRDTLWYLDPAMASEASRKDRKEAAIWGAIADYHAGERRRPPQVTPGWQRPRQPKPEVVDPYEDRLLQHWKSR